MVLGRGSSVMSEAIATSDLLDAIRVQLAAEVSGITVAPRLGDPGSSIQRHQFCEVLSVTTSDPAPGDQQQLYLRVERRIALRWSYAVSSASTDGDALDFARSIREALCGATAFAHRYDLLYGGEPTALARDGGYYTGEIEVISIRAMPTG